MSGSFIAKTNAMMAKFVTNTIAFSVCILTQTHLASASSQFCVVPSEIKPRSDCVAIDGMSVVRDMIAVVRNIAGAPNPVELGSMASVERVLGAPLICSPNQWVLNPTVSPLSDKLFRLQCSGYTITQFRNEFAIVAQFNDEAMAKKGWKIRIIESLSLNQKGKAIGYDYEVFASTKWIGKCLSPDEVDKIILPSGEKLPDPLIETEPNETALFSPRAWTLTKGAYPRPMFRQTDISDKAMSYCEMEASFGRIDVPRSDIR